MTPIQEHDDADSVRAQKENPTLEELGWGTHSHVVFDFQILKY
jgi:hypothetical protein